MVQGGSEEHGSVYYSRVKAIYSSYLEEIVPLIAAIEIYSNKFPVELLNEVRSVFTHFARFNLDDNENNKESEIEKAERHLKRMRFDCYKYVSILLSQSIRKFMEGFSPKVLAGISNGAFRSKINSLLNLAADEITAAKKCEAAGNEDGAINHYDKAVKSYVGIRKYIDESNDAIQHAQALYGGFEERLEEANKRHEEELRQLRESSAKSELFGKLGIAVGFAGIVVGVLVGFFL